MSRRILPVLILGVIFALTTVMPAQAREIAGEVVRLQGTIAATLDGAHRLLGVGDKIYRGELIRTAASTRVTLRLLDGSEITLGDDSDLTIDEFVYKPEQNEGNIALRLTQGVFKALSGGIAHLKDAPLRVTTPIATIGIRGTTFWGEHRKSGSEIAMLKGKGIFIENQFGRVEITTPGVGTVVSPGQAPSPPFEWGKQKLERSAAMVGF